MREHNCSACGHGSHVGAKREGAPALGCREPGCECEGGPCTCLVEIIARNAARG